MNLLTGRENTMKIAQTAEDLVKAELVFATLATEKV
jgi:hypothetical protein